MTRKSNARLAGFMFLFYIATALPEAILSSKISSGEGIAAKLAHLAQHAAMARFTAFLSFITILDAVVLAVALYGLTRDVDRDLSTLALLFRVCEGVINAVSTIGGLGLLYVAQSAATASGADAASLNVLGAFLVKMPGCFSVGATLFACGSTIYAYLFLKSRMIPVPLAWIGLIGSALLVLGLPLEMMHIIAAPVTSVMWIPVAVFEIVLGFWLLFSKKIGAQQS